jgi:hypothetical protein
MLKLCQIWYGYKNIFWGISRILKSPGSSSLDENAILAGIAYVDFNPIRAKMETSP